jgi:hypothetical protein
LPRGAAAHCCEDELNDHAADGWQLVFQTLENKRFMLFWSRETVIVTLAR